MKIIFLKTDPEPFAHSLDGYKTWEIRLNDRGFMAGDILILQETKYSAARMAQEGLPLEYTGRELVRCVTMVFPGPYYALPPDWVLMSVIPCPDPRQVL
jgi:hypothetical protein